MQDVSFQLIPKIKWISKDRASTGFVACVVSLQYFKAKLKLLNAIVCFKNIDSAIKKELPNRQ